MSHHRRTVAAHKIDWQDRVVLDRIEEHFEAGRNLAEIADAMSVSHTALSRGLQRRKALYARLKGRFGLVAMRGAPGVAAIVALCLLLLFSACANTRHELAPADGVATLELWEMPVTWSGGIATHPYFAYSAGNGTWETLQVYATPTLEGEHVYWQIWGPEVAFEAVTRPEKRALRRRQWRGDYAEIAWRRIARAEGVYPYRRRYSNLNWPELTIGPNSNTFGAWMLDAGALGPDDLGHTDFGREHLGSDALGADWKE